VGPWLDVDEENRAVARGMARHRTEGSDVSTSARPDDGVFQALTDFGLTRFATPQLLRIIYAIGAVLTVVVGLGYLVGGLFTGGGFAVAALIGVPLVTLLSLLYLRVLVEIGAAFFRMSQDMRRVADAMGGPPWASGPGGPAAGGPGPVGPGGPGAGPPAAGPGGPPPAATDRGQWTTGQAPSAWPEPPSGPVEDGPPPPR
jgi:hypothetical protein